MGWFESESGRKVREHNEGQEAGSKAGFIDELAASLTRGMKGNEAWDEGFLNGAANKPKSDDE